MPAPRRVPLGAPDAEPAGKISKTLAPLFGMGFAVLAQSGLGEHWAIEKAEAEALAKEAEACIKQLPKGAAKNVMLLLATYAPWIGLAATAYAITAPRVRLTVDIRRVQNLQRLRGPASPGAAVDAASGNAGNGAGSHDAGTGGSVRADARKLFTDGE